MEEVYAGKKSLKERVRVCQRKEKERVEREESGEKWLIGERAKHFARPSVLFLASCFLLLASTPNSDAFFFLFCFVFVFLHACGQPLSPLFDDSFRRADTPRADSLRAESGHSERRERLYACRCLCVYVCVSVCLCSACSKKARCIWRQ